MVSAVKTDKYSMYVLNSTMILTGKCMDIHVTQAPKLL